MKKHMDSLSRPTTDEASSTPNVATETTTATTTTTPTDSFDNMFPEPTIAIAGPPSWVWWAVLVGASLVLGVVGYTLARDNISGWVSEGATPSPTQTVATTEPTAPSPTETPVATPTASATATPTATPATTEVVKSSITLRVLNGTTTTGAAGAAAKDLTAAGFTVRTTGNAKNQTYTTSYVYYQSGKEAEAKEVASALAEYAPVVQESTLANPDHILVVIGKK